MSSTVKFFRKISIQASIMLDFFKTLWKYKLWWGLPIIFLLLFLTLFLLFAGHTGVAALIYPLL